MYHIKDTGLLFLPRACNVSFARTSNLSLTLENLVFTNSILLEGGHIVELLEFNSASRNVRGGMSFHHEKQFVPSLLMGIEPSS